MAFVRKIRPISINFLPHIRELDKATVNYEFSNMFSNDKIYSENVDNRTAFLQIIGAYFQLFMEYQYVTEKKYPNMKIIL